MHEHEFMITYLFSLIWSLALTMDINLYHSKLLTNFLWIWYHKWDIPVPILNPKVYKSWWSGWLSAGGWRWRWRGWPTWEHRLRWWNWCPKYWCHVKHGWKWMILLDWWNVGHRQCRWIAGRSWLIKKSTGKYSICITIICFKYVTNAVDGILQYQKDGFESLSFAILHAGINQGYRTGFVFYCPTQKFLTKSPCSLAKIFWTAFRVFFSTGNKFNYTQIPYMKMSFDNQLILMTTFELYSCYQGLDFQWSVISYFSMSSWCFQEQNE